jgi:integron integrase
MSEYLLTLLQQALAKRGYARRTQQAYELWIRRFLAFHRNHHPREIKDTELNAFLVHLTTVEGVSPSSHHQASSALIFLCHHVLGNTKITASSLKRVPRHEQPPLLLSQEEVGRVLGTMPAPSSLVAGLLYGSGLRLMEALQLRCRDLALRRQEVLIRNGQSEVQRTSILPPALIEPLRNHLITVRQMHRVDLDQGWGRVQLPDDVNPDQQWLSTSWDWQWLFPQRRRWLNRLTGQQGRHHLNPSVVQRALKQALLHCDIQRPAGCQTLRHCFGTHMLELGNELETIQLLMGHHQPRSTRRYSQLKSPGPAGQGSLLTQR